jgi:class 3 adenylate cyclase
MEEPKPYPTGTVILVFTDIEGSTERWERDRVVMKAAADRCMAVLLLAAAAHDGAVHGGWRCGAGGRSAFNSQDQSVAEWRAAILRHAPAHSISLGHPARLIRQAAPERGLAAAAPSP